MSSSKTVLEILNRAEARPAELARARAAGAKVVGWLSYAIPEELIHALGLIPVRLGTGGNERLLELGARYISTKNCVFVREAVGLFAERKDPYVVNSDVVAIDGTCLQLFRTAEVIRHFFGTETLVLGVPRNFHWPEAKAYFHQELQHLVGGLERLAGTRLDEGRLAESVRLFDGIRSATQALYRATAREQAGIRWRDLYDVVQAGFYLDRDEYLGLLHELLAEVDGGAAEPPGADGPPEARLFLSGSVLPPGDRKLVDLIEQVGGRIVGDDLWSGLAPHLKVNIAEPTVKGIADAYLGRVPHAALPYLDLETDGRLANLREQLAASGARGVVYHTLRYCDPFTFKAVETKELLNRAGIPLLEIHTEYARSDFEALRTRVESFVEMLRGLDARSAA